MAASSFEREKTTDLPEKIQTILTDKMEVIGEAEFLKKSVSSNDDLSDYKLQTKKYFYKSDVKSVWDSYVGLNAKEAWTGPKVNFVMAYSRLKHKYYYLSDDVPVFHEGMIIFNYLNFLGPRLIVTIEILRIDAVKKEIEIAYTDHNVSAGTQILKFISHGDNKTEVKHLSYYKSDSGFRDVVVYPLFHSLTVGEFHKKAEAKLND